MQQLLPCDGRMSKRYIQCEAPDYTTLARAVTGLKPAYDDLEACDGCCGISLPGYDGEEDHPLVKPFVVARYSIVAHTTVCSGISWPQKAFVLLYQAPLGCLYC